MDQQVAQVNASMASLEGLLKANPLGAADNPGLSQVLTQRAQDVTASLLALQSGLDAAMATLSPEDRQAALDAYGEFMVDLADIKQIASNRFLTLVSLTLGESYSAYSITLYVWGNTYGLTSPRLPELGV